MGFRIVLEWGTGRRLELGPRSVVPAMVLLLAMGLGGLFAWADLPAQHARHTALLEETARLGRLVEIEEAADEPAYSASLMADAARSMGDSVRQSRP